MYVFIHWVLFSNTVKNGIKIYNGSFLECHDIFFSFFLLVFIKCHCIFLKRFFFPCTTDNKLLKKNKLKYKIKNSSEYPLLRKRHHITSKLSGHIHKQCNFFFLNSSGSYKVHQQSHDHSIRSIKYISCQQWLQNTFKKSCSILI